MASRILDWTFSKARVWLWVPLACLSWLGSGIAAILGFAPEDVIREILGDSAMNTILDILHNMNDTEFRWTFSILSSSLFSIGVLIFIIVPLAKSNIELKNMSRDLAELKVKSNESTSNLKKGLHLMTADAKKKGKKYKANTRADKTSFAQNQ